MILLPGQIECITSRRDKTVKITLGSQELAPSQAAELFMLNQKFCFMAIKEETFQDDEVALLDNLKADLDTNKTPSQRLRSILYINYQQKGDGYKDFNTYYLAKMDQICDHFKSKLE
jgi:hypothetical protein